MTNAFGGASWEALDRVMTAAAQPQDLALRKQRRRQAAAQMEGGGGEGALEDSPGEPHGGP
eukprot:6718250-Pyramimonas_sp.AAC.1